MSGRPIGNCSKNAFIGQCPLKSGNVSDGGRQNIMTGLFGSVYLMNFPMQKFLILTLSVKFPLAKKSVIFQREPRGRE
jgi:hypothetical protein